MQGFKYGGNIRRKNMADNNSVYVWPPPEATLTLTNSALPNNHNIMPTIRGKEYHCLSC